MTLLDTSVLIDSLSGPRRSARTLRSAIEQGERLLIPSVLYEWLRGPRLPSGIFHNYDLPLSNCCRMSFTPKI